MDPDKTPCAPRRGALKFAFNACAGIAMVAVTRGALATPGKLSKDSVKYTDSGNVEGKNCDDCSQYVPGTSARDSASCKIVEGPINPHGHCIAFSPKPKA